MHSTYNFILNNFEDLSTKQFWELVKVMHIESLGLYLKNKFNDTRSVQELTDLIRTEYKLKY